MFQKKAILTAMLLAISAAGAQAGDGPDTRAPYSLNSELCPNNICTSLPGPVGLPEGVTDATYTFKASVFDTDVSLDALKTREGQTTESLTVILDEAFGGLKHGFSVMDFKHFTLHGKADEATVWVTDETETHWTYLQMKESYESDTSTTIISEKNSAIKIALEEENPSQFITLSGRHVNVVTQSADHAAIDASLADEKAPDVALNMHRSHGVNFPGAVDSISIQTSQFADIDDGKVTRYDTDFTVSAPKKALSLKNTLVEIDYRAVTINGSTQLDKAMLETTGERVLDNDHKTQVTDPVVQDLFSTADMDKHTTYQADRVTLNGQQDVALSLKNGSGVKVLAKQVNVVTNGDNLIAFDGTAKNYLFLYGTEELNLKGDIAITAAPVEVAVHAKAGRVESDISIAQAADQKVLFNFAGNTDFVGSFKVTGDAPAAPATAEERSTPTQPIQLILGKSWVATGDSTVPSLVLNDAAVTVQENAKVKVEAIENAGNNTLTLEKAAEFTAPSLASEGNTNIVLGENAKLAIDELANKESQISLGAGAQLTTETLIAEKTSLALGEKAKVEAGSLKTEGDTALTLGEGAELKVAEDLSNKGKTELLLGKDAKVETKKFAADSTNLSLQEGASMKTDELTSKGDALLTLGKDAKVEAKKLTAASSNLDLQEGAALQVEEELNNTGVSNVTLAKNATLNTAKFSAQKSSLSLGEGASFDTTDFKSEGETQISLGAGAQFDAETLTSEGPSTVSLAEGAKLDVGTLDSKGDVNFNTTSLAEGQINIQNNASEGKANVNVDLSQVKDAPANTEELVEKVGNVLTLAEGKSVTLAASDGIEDYVLEKKSEAAAAEAGGKAVTVLRSQTTSEVIQVASDIANQQILGWRTQINDVNKRLGDLRTYEGSNQGGWVRLYGAKQKLKDQKVSSKSNTVQVGFDTKVANNFYVGVTGTYTDGDSKASMGKSDDKAYSFGVYGGWLGDDGQFVDVIVKQSHFSSDFDLRYSNGKLSSGEVSAWGTSISAEYGWRLNLPGSERFWMEPQAEVSYGHLGGDTYTTSAGIKTEQDSINSLIGRLGVAFGATFEKGSAYVKASVAHDWDSKSRVTLTSATGTRSKTLEEDLGGTWGEFAFGGTLNVSKNLAGYAEFMTTVGTPVKTPYQWNLGMRYKF